MEEKQWIEMCRNIQKFQNFSRLVLNMQNNLSLTSMEIEILSHIALDSDIKTPLDISKKTNIKKESISRILKSLFNKDLLIKEKNPLDERSYRVILTDKAIKELDENYRDILKPYYNLEKKLDGEFTDLINLMEKSSNIFKDYLDEKQEVENGKN